MKQFITALTLGLLTTAAAQAQTKKTQVERCHLSADNKYITCCKTTLNPAYNVNNKPVAAKKKAVTHKPAVVYRTRSKANNVHRYQVCTDEGGYYTCCMYESTDGTIKSYW